MMTLSVHATERWEERFPKLNLESELVNLVRLRSKFTRVLRQRHKDVSGCTDRRQYWYSHSGIIFVAAGDVIVTVIKASAEIIHVIEDYLLDKTSKASEQHYSKINGMIKRQKQRALTRKKHCNRIIFNEYLF